MRVAVALVLGVGAIVVGSTYVPSFVRGRRCGRLAADTDIANGTPHIRRDLGFAFCNVDSNGLGIDRDTGLPLENTAVMCGTGLDATEYASEITAYNDRIRAAVAEGKLERFRLGHKLRTDAALRALFATGRATVLASDGDTLRVPEGPYEITCRREARSDGSQRYALELTGPAGTSKSLFLLHGRTLRPAAGPFDGLLADSGTTAILRDIAGDIWVVDLPRDLVVQISSPVR